MITTYLDLDDVDNMKARIMGSKSEKSARAKLQSELKVRTRKTGWTCWFNKEVDGTFYYDVSNYTLKALKLMERSITI